MVPCVACGQPCGLLGDLDGRDVVPLHHVAPEGGLGAGVLLEALGNEGVEADDGVEAVDHASEAA